MNTGPRRRKKPVQLPLKNGLGPTKVVLREDHIGLSFLAALHAKSGQQPEELLHAFSLGEVVDLTGEAIDPHTTVTGITPVFVYREPRPEVPVPFPMPIVLETDTFLIVDKPPFLATIPRGMHIKETVLYKIRHTTGNAEIIPAHRLDRLTSGLVLMVKRREHRGAYQGMFAAGKVTKMYKALAAKPRADQSFPTIVSSNIHKIPGVMRASEEPGPPNAHSKIFYCGTHPSGYGEYELQPITGKTHQLRLHMCRLGLGILGDPLYPIDTMPDSTDFSSPLYLRAHYLSFTDPISGKPITCTSQQNWIFH